MDKQPGSNRQLIAYSCAPNWVVPAVCAVLSFSAMSIVFMPFSLAAIIVAAPVLTGAALVVAETFIRMLALLLIAVLLYYTLEMSRHDYLVLNKDSITFPVFLAPDLLFKRKRSWDDVANVLIGVMLLQDRKGSYEYDLEEAKDNKRLFIYFKSGGHASINLNKMSRQSGEALLTAIEPWCLSCTRAPVAPRQDKEGKGRQTAPAPPLSSFTQMWEDELQLHFSSTNFVPLDKGDTLQSDKFRIVMLLSSGGLSAVYLAESQDNSLVVLKEASLPQSLDEGCRRKAKELIGKEAAILRELRHPKIAKVLDYFVEGGRDYLAIEFVPGESLRQLVRRHGTQSERTVLTVGFQTALILSYLHSRKPPVVHRDITPDNLILKENGEIVLIDFGAANHFVGTATGTLIGKQCYIAPEQFRGKATIQSDVYSLGGTLHFLLTGADPEALSQSHPEASRHDLSQGMVELIADLTVLEAKDRIKSSDEAAERIRQLIPGTVLAFSGARDQ
jgi:tRNA A-37 threonylcarbamoyl transferase component Bud32